MPTQLARFPGLPSAFNPFMPSMVKPRTVGAKRERCKDFDGECYGHSSSALPPCDYLHTKVCVDDVVDAHT